MAIKLEPSGKPVLEPEEGVSSIPDYFVRVTLRTDLTPYKVRQMVKGGFEQKFTTYLKSLHAKRTDFEVFKSEEVATRVRVRRGQAKKLPQTLSLQD
jgi:hypothetical protein